MIDNRIQKVTEPHHRRPRSLKGSTNSSNLSYVEKEPHVNWHVLYGNLNAFQTCERFIQDLRTFEDISCKITCRFINGSQVKKSGRGGSRTPAIREKAFRMLFGGKPLAEKIAFVNNIWLDPSYHFYLTKKSRSTKMKHKI